MVLISLFELNTPEFTMLLGALPKTCQDGATKLLHNHLKNSSNAAVVTHNTYSLTHTHQHTHTPTHTHTHTHCSQLEGVSPVQLMHVTQIKETLFLFFFSSLFPSFFLLLLLSLANTQHSSLLLVFVFHVPPSLSPSLLLSLSLSLSASFSLPSS